MLPLFLLSPYIAAVDEYVPAPGQFVNVLPAYEVGDDAASMAAKCTEYLADNRGYAITLGGWGGYVTFHFDHPLIDVPDQRDLCIWGNAINGSSEAGIVMVSRDDNANGLPDDAWYELSGSADTDSIGCVTYGYCLTYTRQGDLQDISWQDSYGTQGSIPRNAFHSQEYYPCWMEPSLTFSGTLLPTNAHDVSGNGSYWLLDALRYGYVDNRPNSDTEGCSFDLAWAVDPLTRQPVSLGQIHFVRVYTALRQVAGWLGETSTEVSGAIDLHPDAVASLPPVIEEASPAIALPHGSAPPHSARYDLQGRPLPAASRHSPFMIHNHNIFLINHQSNQLNNH